ncbi:HNH endonuclease [Falsiroseomonas sp.]|uniref:HNH endonuclease n=1 Tax=Falsiroseomonas sp. TaxID=2870721 RepID=UPI003F7074A3
MIGLARGRGTGDIPAAFQGQRLTRLARDLIGIYFAAPPAGPFAFKSSAWKAAKTRLKRDSFGKCAYCDAPTSIVAHGDVEHFRPKDSYWWLAHSYDNFVFACQICNQSHKGNKFPIGAAALPPPSMPPSLPEGAALDALVALLVLDSTRVTDADLHRLWGAEEAHLVHPYLEDPEPLVAYEVDPVNEEVWLRSAGGARADRAVQAADDCLGINREELRRERHAHYLLLDAFRQILGAAGLPAAARAIAEREVRRLQASRQPFAGMHRHFARLWHLPPH